MFEIIFLRCLLITKQRLTTAKQRYQIIANFVLHTVTQLLTIYLVHLIALNNFTNTASLFVNKHLVRCAIFLFTF